MTRSLASVVGWGVLVVTASSCQDITPVPLTRAPLNTCGKPSDCAAYAASDVTCKDDLCETTVLSSRPPFPFWVVIHLPDTVSSAPGLAYVLVGDVNGEPSFVAPTSDSIDSRCLPPRCQPINVANAESSYIVSAVASSDVGFPLADGKALPLRVVYESTLQTQLPTLPLGGALVAKSPVPGSIAQRFVQFGLYRRAFYPQPPFDALFPPYRDDDVVDVKGRRFIGNFTLGSIDATRKAKVSREEGLDGWRVWLANPITHKPISVVRTLSGTVASDVPLFTTGVKSSDDFDAVVAPPENWVAVPRFVTPIFGGQGLGTLDYPHIPPPVTVTGVVAERGTGETLLGYAAALSFESQRIATLTEQTSLLRYETTVVTDERGRFATVLPPGRYVATIDPAQGTGHAVKKVLVEVDRSVTSLTLPQAPRLTRVRGRAVLTDGRSLAEADVVALPYAANGGAASELAATPRPGRARTSDDGHFAMELDEGAYVISVIPKPGTGFPRFVVRADIPSSVSVPSTELPDMRVPPPSRLSFRVADVPDRQSPVNPIPNAVVRVFARPVPRSGEGEGDPVEIGNAMTDEDGEVKLLLPPQPR